MTADLYPPPARHPDEVRRLAALGRYRILDAPRDQDFDDIAALASEICRTPIAVVNLIGDGRQWFQAEVGLGVRETPFETSFCGHAILEEEFMLVPDATKDSRFDRNPLVTGAPGLRFYAGALLRTPDGLPIGTLCVLDVEPRTLDARQAMALKRLARQVMTQLELRRIARAQHESEEHYRHAAELNPQVAWTAAADGQLDRVAERWREWTGTSGLGDSWGQGLHPDDLGFTLAAWTRSVETGTPYDVEHRVRLRSGATRWARSRAFPRRDEAGGVAKWYGATEDIHERRQAEDALRALNATLEQLVSERTAALQASEARMRTVFETSYTLQGLMNLDGTLLDANATSLRVAGTTLRDVVGRKFWDTPWFTATEGMPALVRTAIGSAAAGRPFRMELALTLPAGLRCFDFSINPIRDRTGAVVALVPEAVDITERRKAEESLRHAQKIEALGQLTGGVAHDFNNLLMVISGGLDLMARTLDPARQQRVQAGMRQAVERGAGLSRQLLAFSRKQALRPQPLDLCTLVGGMDELLERSLRGDVEVRSVFAEGLWPVEVDPGELELVLLNLAVNARDAMPDGGTITIAGENAPGLDDDGLHGDFVCVSVTDTGTGMTPEVLSHAFEPFFTTKEVGLGSGLGLAQAHGFAVASGGRVRIASQVGRGTSVMLLLPRTLAAPAALGRVTAAVPIGPELHASGQVLLVEDDEEVAALTAEMVRQLGYGTMRVGSAEAALGALSNGRRIDVVLSDVMMPGAMNGLDLAREVRRRRPGLPILLASGYAASTRAEAGAEGIVLLDKPYRLDELAAALAKVQGQGQGQGKVQGGTGS